MAKAIRWQIPFVSVTGKHYRIDIYDEGWTGSITTLTAGPNPFTTDEDASDDFFAPIRTQTGNIEVCTAIPGGGTLSLEDILPENNIARPVRLVSIAADNSEKIEWQGFLSCEAYSQDYVGIPQILQLPVISVLEAMGSVECDIEKLQGTQRVYNILAYLFGAIQDEFGSYFNYIHISGAGEDFIYKFVNTSIFYESKERKDENYTEEFTVGITLKEALEILATFMGWVVREQGNDFYLQTAGGEYQMMRTTIDELYEDQPIFSTYVLMVTENIADMTWRGVGHQQSSNQGARNVEVVAELEQFDINIDIPSGFPKGDYIQAANGMLVPAKSEEDEDYTAKVYISKELNFNSKYDLQVFNIEDYNASPFFDLVVSDDVQDLYDHSDFDSQGVTTNSVAGAAMLRALNHEEGYDIGGVFIRGTDLAAIKDDIVESDYILKIRSIDHLNAYNGSLKLELDGIGTDGVTLPETYNVSVAVKWGNKFLQADMQTWSESFAYITVTKQEDPVKVTITEYNDGEVCLLLMPFTMRNTAGTISLQQFILTKLSLTYENPEHIYDDDGTNTYFEPLHTAFSEDKTISTAIGSSLKNLPSPSLVLNIDPQSSYNPLITMPFYDGVEKVERPEINLLNRMAAYYKKARTVLDLEVAMPSVPLPILQLRGINDNRAYLPLSVSRDWCMDTVRLKAFEVPLWLIIRKSSGMWNEQDDYILLPGAGTSETIYISSPTDLHWADRDFQLQSVYINGENGGGDIPAGQDVTLTFYSDDDVYITGWIDIYRGTELVFSIFVKQESL